MHDWLITELLHVPVRSINLVTMSEPSCV